MWKERIKYWLLKRIIKKEVKQSHWHYLKIIHLFEMIHDACENEFTEDNKLILDDFLQKCFEQSLKSKPKI